MTNYSVRRFTSLYFIVIGAFLLFISGDFLTDGLSRVGVDNAVISQRMYEGHENFWLPSLDTPGNPDRSKYLPLGYWLESKWFSVFHTNSFLVEKFYSVFIFIILGLLMVWIWTLMENSLRTGWLPLLCWLLYPIVSWSATSNLLECTMTCFILLSVAFMLKGSKSSLFSRKRSKQYKLNVGFLLGRIAWFVLAAVMMELAVLIKGFAGLFPIFFPFIYWLIVRRESVIIPIFETLTILVVWFATLGVVALTSPVVTDHIFNYFHGQIIGGVLHEQTVASHFFIVYALVKQSLIPILVLGVLCLLRFRMRPVCRYLLHWCHKDELSTNQIYRSRMGWFFFVLGLFGVLPIMIGLKQQEFYLIPTLPFFAIAIACLAYELIIDWLEMMNTLTRRVLSALAVVLLVIGIILNMASIHKVTSNHVLFSDMKQILPSLEKNECITVTPEILSMSEVEEFFYRYKGITFDTTWGSAHLMTLYGSVPHHPEEYQPKKCDLYTTQFNLWDVEAVEK